jgi:hypothetical protein
MRVKLLYDGAGADGESGAPTNQPPPAEASAEYAAMVRAFRLEVAGALGVDQRRITVADGRRTAGGLLIDFDILPPTSTAETHAPELSATFIRLVAEHDAVLYRGSVTSRIDAEFMPRVIEGAPASTRKAGMKPGVAAAIAIGVIVVVCAILFAVWRVKQKVIVDWLLWRLGGFRFQRFVGGSRGAHGGGRGERSDPDMGSELGAMDNDVDAASRRATLELHDDGFGLNVVLPKKSAASIERRELVARGASDSADVDDGVGHEAWDDMPLPNDRGDGEGDNFSDAEDMSEGPVMLHTRGSRAGATDADEL